MNKKNVLLNVVIPVYNEEKNISNAIKVIMGHIEKLDLLFELYLIDDGSRDKTPEIISGLACNDSRIKFIGFVRNFGKEAAIKAGLDYADGDAVIVMDCDLQHPPELIGRMVALWKDEGYKLVHCKKSGRGKESIFYKLSAGLFYSVFNKLTGGDFRGSSDFRLLDREVVLEYRTLTERNAFFRGLVDWFGYKTATIDFKVPERVGGESKWTLGGLVGLSVKAVTSFSKIPLHIVTILGTMFLIFSLILAVQTLINFIIGNPSSGFTTVILLLLITGSCIMISLGIIGEYLSKMYDEIKARPMYITDHTKNINKGNK